MNVYRKAFCSFFQMNNITVEKNNNIIIRSKKNVSRLIEENLFILLIIGHWIFIEEKSTITKQTQSPHFKFIKHL